MTIIPLRFPPRSESCAGSAGEGFGRATSSDSCALDECGAQAGAVYDDGGRTWEPMGDKFAYEGVAGTHQWYDGTQHPWEFKRIWHLEPSLTDPETVYAGVEDAALFKTTDGGKTWEELPGLRTAKGNLWQPGAGGMCLHTILLDPGRPDRIFIAISAAGAFRTDDGGKTWRQVNSGLKSK